MRNFIAIGVLVGVSVAAPPIYQSLIDRADQIKSQRLDAEAGKAKALAVKTSTGGSLSGRSARIEADAKGHFNAAFKLNGRRIDAMVDTGATVVAINRSTARKIGISLAAANFNRTVSTANGDVKAAAAVIDVLEIGRVRLEGVQALVLDDKALQTSLIGMSALNRLARFKVEGKVLLLEQ